MQKETIYTLSSLYRDDLRVTGYRFGSGEKSVCIAGAMRGDETQQLYTSALLIKALREMEEKGEIAENHEILVIPSMNCYSMNAGRRFWCLDNNDINREFPGKEDGETTERVAAAVFREVSGYKYCVQFPSFYIHGDFVPHVRMMKTGHSDIETAKLFGLRYIVLREPSAMDKSTLNYSLLSSGAAAFSIYSKTRESIDKESAEICAEAVKRFMARLGVLTAAVNGGEDSEVVEEAEMINVKSEDAGFFRPKAAVGDEVKKGDVLAELLHPYELGVISKITAPEDGAVFFSHKAPLLGQHAMTFKLVGKK